MISLYNYKKRSISWIGTSQSRLSQCENTIMTRLFSVFHMMYFRSLVCPLKGFLPLMNPLSKCHFALVAWFKIYTRHPDGGTCNQHWQPLVPLDAVISYMLFNHCLQVMRFWVCSASGSSGVERLRLLLVLSRSSTAPVDQTYVNSPTLNSLYILIELEHSSR